MRELVVCLVLLGCQTTTKPASYRSIASAWATPESFGSLDDPVPFDAPDSYLVGYRSRSGAVVFPPRFLMASTFNRYGIADVLPMDRRHWYRMDRQGRLVLRAYPFDNGPDYYVAGLARYLDEESGKIGFSDPQAKIVVPATFDWASPFRQQEPHLAMVCQGCTARPVHPEGDGCQHSVMAGGRWGIINRAGKVVVPIVYDRIDDTKERMLVQKGEACHEVQADADGNLRLEAHACPSPSSESGGSI